MMLWIILYLISVVVSGFLTWVYWRRVYPAPKTLGGKLADIDIIIITGIAGPLGIPIAVTFLNDEEWHPFSATWWAQTLIKKG